jgi:hypothetical protein
MGVSLAGYLAGAAWLALVVGGSVAVGVLALRSRRDLEPSFRALGVAVLAVATVVVVHLVPGALGILGRGTVLATTGLAVVAAAIVDRRLSPTEAPAGARRGDGVPWVDWLPAIVAAGLVAAFALAYLDARRSTAISEVDSLTFHLPQVVRWLQTRTFWRLDNFLPGWAFGDYPNSANVLQLASVLPWRDDAFVRFVNLPLLVLAAGGVAVSSWELGARRSTAVIAGAAAAAVPVMLGVSVVGANTDTAAYAGFAVGVAFLARAHRSNRLGDVALAGVGFGLAFGSKWYGVSSVALVVALWAAWRVASPSRGSMRAIAARVGALVAGSVVLGGYWLLRNLVLSNNPVSPVRVAVGHWVVFDAPFDRMRALQGFSIADYLADRTVLREYIWVGLKLAFGWTGALAVVGVAVAGVVAIRRKASLPLAFVAAACALLLLYVVTPYTAMGPRGRPYLFVAAARYAGPVIVVALPVGAWALSQAAPLLRRVVEWGVVLVVVDALHRTAGRLDVGLRDLVVPGRVLVGAALVALVVAVVVAYRRDVLLARPIAAGMVIVLVVALLATGRRIQEEFRVHRYRGVDPAYDAVLARAPSGHVIALAGDAGDANPPPLILHGYRFGNRVEYIGPVEGGVLGRYTSAPAFDRALAASAADYLVVGLGVPPRPAEQPPEERWARALGWRAVVRSSRLAVLEHP